MSETVPERDWLDAAHDPAKLERLTKAATPAVAQQPQRISSRASTRRTIDVILRAVAPVIRDLTQRVKALEAAREVKRVREIGRYEGSFEEGKEYDYGAVVYHETDYFFCERSGITHAPGAAPGGWSVCIHRNITHDEESAPSEEHVEKRIAALERDVGESLRYRGIWQATTYAKGSVVTLNGSWWLAERETDARPGGADSGWRLTVKGQSR